ncbi:PLP-dependent aminotransferase family protein [Verticiella sediminum]|uniref:PLP-dependent aminotransferase family protein n=1 Tax=Verticiella sediminum TaxID=1247510 RepID=A0A556B1F1_9BURK|nr:PLP-dependent aminotransferase family protein [Verticiella sediminum]TSH99021.1 PLP-dependent aminotransferase family protein [Verticiella sediminum]
MSFAFAERYREPAGSPIRELFPYLSLPGMISFAGGYPSAGLFDAEGLRVAAGNALLEAGASLQYGPTQGDPLLVQALVQACGARGIACAPADVLVTTGSQQAFDLLVRTGIDPGDVVCVESPTYPAVLQTLRLAGARIQDVPVDAEGLDVDALADWLRGCAPADRPKLVYTVPTFSNPSGTTLSPARREALVALAREYGFLIVEDDPYSELRFAGAPVASLYRVGAAAGGGDNPVIYLSSLSKTVAPALRIGWMVGRADVLRRCTVAKQTADLCTSGLAQRIAAAYLDSGRYAPTVARACAEYAARMRAMMQALRADLAEWLDAVEPAGGMFVWARARRPLDAERLFKAAVEARVLFVPGKAFRAVPTSGTALRLSFAASGVEAIEEGMRRLGQALRTVPG